jgi:tripeptidyl-peptidase-1
MPQVIPTPPKNRFQRRAIPDPHAKLGSPNSFNGPKTNNRKVGGSTTLGLDDCNEFITPICLQTLYNFRNVRPVQTRRNTFGVVEFTPQAFLQEDLGELESHSGK